MVERKRRPFPGLRQFSELFARWNEPAITCEQVHRLIQCCMAHHVTDSAMPHQPGLVQVVSLAYPNEVRNLRRAVKTCAMASVNPCRRMAQVGLNISPKVT